MPLDLGSVGGRGRGWVRNSSLVVTGAIEMLAIGDAWSEILEVSRRAEVVLARRRRGAVAVPYDAPVPGSSPDG